MEEKKIIIDVTWKTAVSIWWKFFVINLFALFAVWYLWTLVNNYEPTPQELTNSRVYKPTPPKPLTEKQKELLEKRQKKFEECFAEELFKEGGDVNKCD